MLIAKENKKSKETLILIFLEQTHQNLLVVVTLIDVIN